MNPLISFKSRPRVGAVVALMTAAFYVASMSWVAGGETNAPAAKAAEVKPPEVKAATKTAKKKLTGGELYAINCNRCHAERYATEFTAAQWKTLMTHMRVRANLPAAQAKLILKYLQEDSGN
jgi:mono/diheme cytochrome c family protein